MIPMMKYYLGLDVGGTNLVAAVVDSDCRILSKASRPSGAGRSIEEITTDFADVSMEAVPLREELLNCTFGAAEIGIPDVVPATLGNDAGLIGAAFLGH